MYDVAIIHTWNPRTSCMLFLPVHRLVVASELERILFTYYDFYQTLSVITNLTMDQLECLLNYLTVE